jgi:polar amino acid transport system substrate-binding protein
VTLVIGLAGAGLLPPPAALEARPLRVGVSGTAPFVFRDGASYNGISVGVWSDVARQGALDYRLISQPSVEANLQALGDGAIDVAIGPISITPERIAMEGIEFSQPYFYSQIGLLVPARTPTVWSRIRPFFHLAALSSIGVFLLGLFLVGNLIWLAEREKNSQQFPPGYLHGVGNGMWFALVTLTTVGYGDRHPVTLVGRWIAGVWMIITLLAVSSITAGLASAFTVSLAGVGADDFQSAADLKGSRMAVIRGTTSETWAEYYGARMIRTDSLQSAIALVEGGEVQGLIYDIPALKYHLQTHPDKPLRVAGFALATESYGFAFRQGEGLEKPIDVSLLNLHQQGRITAISEAWLE